MQTPFLLSFSRLFPSRQTGFADPQGRLQNPRILSYCSRSRTVTRRVLRLDVFPVCSIALEKRDERGEEKKERKKERKKEETDEEGVAAGRREQSHKQR